MRLTPEVMARSQTVCNHMIHPTRASQSTCPERGRGLIPDIFPVSLNDLCVPSLIALIPPTAPQPAQGTRTRPPRSVSTRPTGHHGNTSRTKPPSSCFPLFFTDTMLVVNITGLQIPLIENLASHQGTYDTLNFTDNSLVSLGNIPLGE